MTRSRWILPMVGILLLACSPPKLGPGVVTDTQLITEEEIEASRGTNAFEVIRKVRGNFLTYRGETSANRNTSRPYPTVYLDDQQFGSIETLRTIPASQISSIRLFRAWEATTKFGAHNMGGVIAITTKQ
jgi:outer membrane receptor for ferrienterochelin and colicin